MPLFEIDTIVTYRMKYVIEADELEHAYDEITMKDSGNQEHYFDEVSQKYLGETIVSGRKLKRKRFNELLINLKNTEGEQIADWMGEKLIRKVKYD